jgi:hypothetical protein
MTTVSFELTWLAAAADERAATLGAGRTVSGFGLPIGGLTMECQILEHAGAQPIPALIKCVLDFG